MKPRIIAHYRHRVAPKRRDFYWHCPACKAAHDCTWAELLKWRKAWKEFRERITKAEGKGKQV